MSKRPETTTRLGGPGTTGHSWDGIEEFNNPLPRWWLWIFYATIVWALIYSVAYPAWPLLTRATPGVLGHSTRADVAAEIAHGLMQWTHGGLFFALGVEVEHADGAGGRGVGRDGGEKNKEQGFHGQWCGSLA